MIKCSPEEADDHMRARFGLDPRRLRRHRHTGISNLEQRLYFGLPHEENDLVLVQLLLIDDPRHVS
jgi:hypothetical protein